MIYFKILGIKYLENKTFFEKNFVKIFKAIKKYAI
jgi:hypothetical protein